MLLIPLSQLCSLERAVEQFENNDGCHFVTTVSYLKRVKMISQNKGRTIITIKIESYQLREGTEASRRLRFHERTVLSRREAFLRPARARCSCDHFGTVSVRSKLPPLLVSVSPSHVSREASRALWRSIGPSTTVVFKLLTSL